MLEANIKQGPSSKNISQKYQLIMSIKSCGMKKKLKKAVKEIHDQNGRPEYTIKYKPMYISKNKNSQT